MVGIVERAQGRGEMLRRDAFARARQRHRALDFVAQLTHVAGPAEFHQQLERRRFEAGDGFALLLGGDGMAVVAFATVVPVWIGDSLARFAIVTMGFTAAHFVFQVGHHRMVREYCQYDISQDGDDERIWDILGQSHFRRG
jgi:hypothetical protein